VFRKILSFTTAASTATDRPVFATCAASSKFNGNDKSLAKWFNVPHGRIASSIPVPAIAPAALPIGDRRSHVISERGGGNVSNVEVPDRLQRSARCVRITGARVNECRNHVSTWARVGRVEQSRGDSIMEASGTRSIPARLPILATYETANACRKFVTTDSKVRSSNGFCMTVQRVR
jgi:hypothetical protein